jgi:hypothetical protein
MMGAKLPVLYADLVHRASRMAQAHQYFSETIVEWIWADDESTRAALLTNVLPHQVQVVVIQLGPDEDAQEIFETLTSTRAPAAAGTEPPDHRPGRPSRPA